MSESRSDFISVRGLRYHVRRWGPADAPILFLAHGWMDVSATFEPVAQRLTPQFQVLIPDWRGFGETQWPQDGYWFPDYVADLDAILDHYAPIGPVRLAGHSMGAQVVALYAGIRPQRVAKLAILDGLFLPEGNLAKTPQRYAKWLDHVQSLPPAPAYASFDELAGRVRKRHPRLTAEHCTFIARCWGRQDPDGRIRLRSDPKHLLEMPRPYRQDESDAVWSCITAETLFVDAEASALRLALASEELTRRRSLFRNHSQIVMPDAGHMLHFEQPQKLAALLAEFFTL
ncbi:MAG: alpha/beta fold hydrolase [Panacagrimonas sp.]